MPDATHFVAPALGAEPHDGPGETCGFCGRAAPSRPAESVLKENFTNRDELGSPWVCWACEACLNDSRTRSSHLVAAGVFRRLERKEIWPLLLDPPVPPSVMYFSLTGKKHGLFRQEIATSRDAWRLQCEDTWGWFARWQCEGWMRAAVRLRLLGVRRESLETGRYESGDYLKARTGIAEWEAIVKPVRPSQLFTILLGTIPGKEDLGGLS